MNIVVGLIAIAAMAGTVGAVDRILRHRKR
jgi:hypothetical protein